MPAMQRPEINRPAILENIPALHTRVLKNGITMHHLSHGDERVMRISVIWNGGLCEAKDHSAAEIAVQMMQLATQTKGRDLVADSIDYNGAILSSAMMSHHSQLIMATLVDRIEETIPLLADLTANPLLPTEDLQSVKSRTISRIATARKKVTLQALHNETERIFGTSHPMSRLTNTDIIKGLDIEDVKEEHFHLFNSNRPEIWVSGFVDEKSLDKVASEFESLPIDLKKRPLNIIEPQLTGQRDNVIETPLAQQCAVRISIPTVTRENDDYCSIRFLVQLLGGFFGSRLMTEIRERQGLTYGITSVLAGHREKGLISIKASCDKNNVKRLVEEVKRQLTLLATEPVSAEELERTKRMSLTSLASTFDTSHNITDYYISGELQGYDNGYYNRQVETILSMTPDRLMEIAGKYMKDIPYITVAGNIAREEINEYICSNN